MNKFFRIVLATLGAVYAGFSIFIPVSVSLLLISTGLFSQFNNTMLIIMGILASVYKGISIGFIR